jgi:uncharacterized protein
LTAWTKAEISPFDHSAVVAGCLVVAERTLRAIVTGASSGIGEAYAERLARVGYDLILVGSRADPLERRARQLVENYEIRVQVLPADLETEDGIRRVTDRIEKGSSIDILVNSAGSPARGRLSNPDPDALGAKVRVNIVAMSRLSHSAMGRMLPNRSGSLINIAPAASLLWPREINSRSTFRSFTAAFTRHLQMEAEGTGVRVQLLIPGVVATEVPAIAESDLSRLPPAQVIAPVELVDASLRALELGEPICCPLFPIIKDWDAFVNAEQLLSGSAQPHPVPGSTVRFP